MSLQHVGLQVVELFIAQTADLFSTVGLEYLVGHPEVLVEVGDLLATLRAGVPLFEMNKLDMTVVV